MLIWADSNAYFGASSALQDESARLSSTESIVIIYPGCWLVFCPAQLFSLYADVAQLVEHGTRNTGVMGSNPIVGFGLGSDTVGESSESRSAG